MTLPTLSIDFEELITRVAESMGIAYYGAAGDEDAQIPTDTADLAQCKRIVNDGWRRFISIRQKWNWMKPLFEIELAVASGGTATSATPTTLVDSALAGTYADDYFNGWTLNIISGTGEDQSQTITDYTGATGTFTVASWTTTPDTTSIYAYVPPRCVEGDVGMYYMPDGYYGRVMGEMNYLSEQGTNRVRIDLSDPTTIRRLYSQTLTLADPTEACILPLTGTDAGRWAMWVWPIPTAELTVQGQCEIYPNALVELTDVPNCGFALHRGVLQACLYEAAVSHDSTNTNKVEMARAEWMNAAQESVAWDRENSPKRLGAGYRGYGSHANYTGADTYTSGDGTVYPLNL